MSAPKRRSLVRRLDFVALLVPFVALALAYAVILLSAEETWRPGRVVRRREGKDVELATEWHRVAREDLPPSSTQHVPAPGSSLLDVTSGTRLSVSASELEDSELFLPVGSWMADDNDATVCYLVGPSEEEEARRAEERGKFTSLASSLLLGGATFALDQLSDIDLLTSQAAISTSLGGVVGFLLDVAFASRQGNGRRRAGTLEDGSMRGAGLGAAVSYALSRIRRVDFARYAVVQMIDVFVSIPLLFLVDRVLASVPALDTSDQMRTTRVVIASVLVSTTTFYLYVNELRFKWAVRGDAPTGGGAGGDVPPSSASSSARRVDSPLLLLVGTVAATAFWNTSFQSAIPKAGSVAAFLLLASLLSNSGRMEEGGGAESAPAPTTLEEEPAWGEGYLIYAAITISLVMVVMRTSKQREGGDGSGVAALLGRAFSTPQKGVDTLSALLLFLLPPLVGATSDSIVATAASFAVPSALLVGSHAVSSSRLGSPRRQ